MIGFRQVHGPAIEILWPAIEPLLARGYAHAGFVMDAAKVRGEAESGRRQLWVVHDGDAILAAATSLLIVGVDGGMVCSVEAFAGRRLKSWLHLWPKFEALAKAGGVSLIQIVEARSGFMRLLRDYRPVRITLEKRL